MVSGLFMRRDPWWEDGTGARRDRTRHRIVGLMAFAMAIGACGLTTAVWLRTLFPILGAAGLGLA